MRTLLFGATLVMAFLLPAGQASAQTTGGGQATHEDHAAHATAAAPAAGCCAGHQMAATAKPMACCNHGAKTDAVVPADDPAVALAGLGLVDLQLALTPATEPANTGARTPRSGETASHGVPVVR
jgi:hypothetical protein